MAVFTNIDGNVKIAFWVAAGAAVADYDGLLWIADGPYELIDAAERHGTAGAAANIQVFKVPSGTAKSAGTNMLSAAGFDATLSANVVRTFGPSATIANARLVSGDAVGIELSAASAALDAVSVTVRLKARSGV